MKSKYSYFKRLTPRETEDGYFSETDCEGDFEKEAREQCQFLKQFGEDTQLNSRGG
jgi:hypothetical protein